MKHLNKEWGGGGGGCWRKAVKRHLQTLGRPIEGVESSETKQNSQSWPYNKSLSMSNSSPSLCTIDHAAPVNMQCDRL